MKIKLFASFALIGLASAVIALIRIAIGHDATEAVTPNIIIGGACVACMYLLFIKERRQIVRRN